MSIQTLRLQLRFANHFYLTYSRMISQIALPIVLTLTSPISNWIYKVCFNIFQDPRGWQCGNDIIISIFSMWVILIISPTWKRTYEKYEEVNCPADLTNCYNFVNRILLIWQWVSKNFFNCLVYKQLISQMTYFFLKV